MLSRLKRFGEAANTLRGWLWVGGTLVPSTATFITGLMEGFSWTFIIPLTIGTAALAVAFLYHVMKAWDYAAAKIGAKAEKERILTELKDYEESGYHSIDLPTAAAIWAGTLTEGDVRRHLCFRKLKAAVRTKKMRPTIDIQSVNMKTMVFIKDLRQYFDNEVFK